MNLKRIIVSDFLTTVMSSSLTIYIYWFSYQYFSSQTIISMIGFGQLCGIFLSSLGGGISDSINKLFFIKLLKFLKVILLFAIFSVEKVVSMEIILPIFMFFSAIIGGLLSPSLESIVPFLSDSDEELFRINSIVSSLSQVASIVSVVLSALYISFLSFSEIIFLTFVATIISVVLLTGITVETTLQSSSVLKNMLKGVSFICNTAYIRNLIPVALVVNFSFWSIFLLLPKIANDNFSFFNVSYSGLELSFAIGGIIGGVLFSKFLCNVKNKFSLFRRTLLLQSVSLLILGFALLIPNKLLAYVGVLLCWFLYSMINTIFSILYFGNLQLKIPREIIGSVFGSMLTMFSLVNPLSAIMSGLLVSSFEIPTLVILLSMMMLMAVLGIRFLPDIETAFD